MTLLATHHISVKQVKKIFKLFQAKEATFSVWILKLWSLTRQSYYWSNAFQLLQRLWHGRDGRPDNYFEFDGHGSGLMLPPLKFPPSAYTVCMWVMIESFSSPFVKDTYQPYLYSLVTEEGVGVETFIYNGKLAIRTIPNTSPNNPKKETKIINYNLDPGRWYFIAATHEYHYLKNDQINMYIDGELVQTNSLAYPKPDRVCT